MAAERSSAGDRGRQQVSKDVEKRARRHVDKRLAEIPLHLDALREAVSEIGEEFAVQELRAIYTEGTAEGLNRALTVERGFEVLHNYMVELVKYGLILGGQRTEGESLDAPRDLRRARDAEMISPKRCERLIRMQRIRNLLQHEYADATPEEVHEAVALLLTELPGFMDDYARWLEKLESTEEPPTAGA